MINQFTFNNLHKTLEFGPNTCINGVILNPNQVPLILQITDLNFLTNQIEIPPNSKFHFKDLRVKKMTLVSGSGVMYYSPDGQDVNIGLENIPPSNISQQYYLSTYFYTYQYSKAVTSAFTVGFYLSIPPQTGIKIKRLFFFEKPGFFPTLQVGSVTYSQQDMGLYLLTKLSSYTTLCTILKGNNQHIQFQNGEVYLLMSTYSSQTNLCGKTLTPRYILYYSNTFDYTTFNFSNSTMTLPVILSDLIPGGKTYSDMQVNLGIIVEPIPPTAKITKTSTKNSTETLTVQAGSYSGPDVYLS